MASFNFTTQSVGRAYYEQKLESYELLQQHCIMQKSVLGLPSEVIAEIDAKNAVWCNAAKLALYCLEFIDDSENSEVWNRAIERALSAVPSDTAKGFRISGKIILPY